MLSRITRLMTVMCWLAGAVLGYQVVDTLSSSTPLSTTATVTITQWHGTGSAQALRNELLATVDQQRLIVGQVVPDVRQGRSLRHVYLAAPDRSIDPGLLGGDFGEGTRTVIHPLGDAGARTPVGNWIVVGQPAQADSIAAWFRSHGAVVRVDRAAATPPRLPYVASPVQSILGVMLLMVVATGASMVVSHTRKIAIERLHGTPTTSILRQEVSSLVIWGAAAGVVTLVGCTLLSFLRYQGAGLAPFLWVTACFALGLLTALIASVALTVQFVTQVEVLGAIKGRIPSFALTASAYVLRIAAVAAALSVAAGSLGLLQLQGQQNAATAPLDRLGDASSITLGNAYTEQEQTRLGRIIGGWLREQDTEGQAVVALQRDLSMGSTMVVNRAFLSSQPIGLHDGTTFSPGQAKGLTAVLPPRLWPRRAQVEAALAQELADLIADSPSGITTVEAAPGLILTPLSAASPQGGASAQIEEPIVVMSPTPLVGGYVEGATKAQVLLKDPDVALSQVQASPDLSLYVKSITPVSQNLATARAELDQQLANSLFATAVSYLVVLAAGVAATLIHTRQHAQRGFVRYLHGWPLLSTYPALVVTEAAILLIVLAWFPVMVLRRRRELAPLNAIAPIPGGLPTIEPSYVVASGLLAVILVFGFLITLATAHRKIVRNGANEA